MPLRTSSMKDSKVWKRVARETGNYRPNPENFTVSDKLLGTASWCNASILSQSALEFCTIHCPNGRLGQDLGFGGIAFALKLPELLNRNLAADRTKLGQTSCFPNGPQIWCPIGQ